ncbi:MAG TPA: hypothetical protein VFF94_12900, partial [Novosphingobium sp.]|nr:hypothetical protein [Novosphingobium sp.]
PMQHRSWPDLTPEDERRLKSAFERWELVPTHYGAYTDMSYYHALDARFDFQIRQFKTARQLGYRIVRIQSPGVDPILERLVGAAEKMGLKLAIEIHVPKMFENPEFQALLAQVRQISSPSLGFIIDTGIFEDVTGVRRFIGEAVDAQPFAPSRPETMLEFMPLIMGLHGKFHRMDKGQIPEVPFERIVSVLAQGRFDGWMSTEFEGGQLGAYSNSFAVVQAHHRLMKTFIARYY